MTVAGGIGLSASLVLGDAPASSLSRRFASDLKVPSIHLSILFGMAAMAFWETPQTFFMVFIVLKTMSDLSWLLPQGEITIEPPVWLAWMGRLGKDKDGEGFAECWRRTHAKGERIQRKNERFSSSEPTAITIPALPLTFRPAG